MGVVLRSTFLSVFVLLVASASVSSKLLAEDALIVPGTTPSDLDGLPVRFIAAKLRRLPEFWKRSAQRRLALTSSN